MADGEAKGVEGEEAGKKLAGNRLISKLSMPSIFSVMAVSLFHLS
jgi:hypothetical protein